MKTNTSWMLCSLLIIVLATCIHEGHGIKCWDCRSDIDPQCFDPFDNTTMTLTDCDLIAELPNFPGVKATMCRKIRQRVNGESKVIRTCARLDEPSPTGNGSTKLSCITRANKHKMWIEECTCKNKDGCNTGPMVYSNQFFILFASVLTFFMNSF